MLITVLLVDFTVHVLIHIHEISIGHLIEHMHDFEFISVSSFIALMKAVHTSVQLFLSLSSPAFCVLINNNNNCPHHTPPSCFKCTILVSLDYLNISMSPYLYRLIKTF